MAVFVIVRAWHMDLDLTGRKMFRDDESLSLLNWAKQALCFVLVEKTVEVVKHRLLLQQARAVVASSFAHALLQEHRLAVDAGMKIYTKYWLGPQEQIGEVEADLVFTETEIVEFDAVMMSDTEELEPENE